MTAHLLPVDTDRSTLGKRPDAAREAARRGDGRFGPQPVGEAVGVDLSTSDAADSDPTEVRDFEADPSSPFDDTDWVRFTDLVAGDRFLREAYSASEGGDVAFVEVEVIGEPTAARDRFGRAMQNLPCRRLDSGAEGPVMFGPQGSVHKCRTAPAVTSETEAWDHISQVTPQDPRTLLAGSERVTVSGYQEFHNQAVRRGLTPGDPPRVTLLADDDPGGPRRPDVTGAYRVVGNGIDRTFGFDAGRRSNAQWAAAEFVAALADPKARRDLLLRDVDRSPDQQ